MDANKLMPPDHVIGNRNPGSDAEWQPPASGMQGAEALNEKSPMAGWAAKSESQSD